MRADRKSFIASVFLLFASVIVLFAQGGLYRSFLLDEQGQLTIEMDSGESFKAPLQGEQMSFASPRISLDHRTVGWLGLFPESDSDYGRRHPTAFRLVIYSDGNILRTFATPLQVFWDWHFENDGRTVAYSIGPTHGGAAECVLRDVTNGRILARWDARSDNPPSWVENLRY